MKQNPAKTGDPALIRETQKEERVVRSYGKTKISIDFKLDGFESELVETTVMKFKKECPDDRIDGWYYTLSDGKEYHENDLIIGREEIRDHKIQKLDGIQ